MPQIRPPKGETRLLHTIGYTCSYADRVRGGHVPICTVVACCLRDADWQAIITDDGDDRLLDALTDLLLALPPIFKRTACDGMPPAYKETLAFVVTAGIPDDIRETLRGCAEDIIGETNDG